MKFGNRCKRKSLRTLKVAVVISAQEISYPMSDLSLSFTKLQRIYWENTGNQTDCVFPHPFAFIIQSTLRILSY